MRGGDELRLRLVFVVGSLVLLLLVGRGAQLCLVRHAELKQAAENQQTQVLEIPPQRGPLLDRCGRTLACTLENPSLTLHLTPEADRWGALEAFLQAGACTEERAREIALSKTAGFFWLNRKWVSWETLERLREALPGLRSLPEMKRFYPSGPLAHQTLGLVGTDGHGLSGLEWRFDTWLSGRPGRVLQFVTGCGRPDDAPPAQVLEEPVPGGGLVLTIDARVQEIARHRLCEGMARTEAQEGFVIVLDPWTGRILALACQPSLDPLLPGRIPSERLRVNCIMDQYEPGSVYKIVALSAGLDAGLVSPGDTIDCCNGVRRVGGCPIHDMRKFGRITVAEILIYSSNIGAGLIAEKCGWERFCGMAQAFGFGLATGVELGGEAAGRVPHPLRETWSARSLATCAYGQEVACTGLQLALAFAAIANGGILMKPLLVNALLDPDGRTAERFAPQVVRRVISRETAQTMRGLLRRVVTEGTGRAAEVADCAPAGKSGTAQVFDPQTGVYSRRDHILSFVGFAPYDDPGCVCLVSLRTESKLHAGEAAAPVFRDIVRDLMWIMEGPGWDSAPIADPAEAPVLIPDVRGLEAEAARQVIRRVGLRPVLEGSGGRVTGVTPAPYGFLSPGGVVRLFLGGCDSRASVKVPDLRGLSLRRAVVLLTEAGLSVAVWGSGWVTQQTPAAGAEVEAGRVCKLGASPEGSRARREAVRRRDLACGTATTAQPRSR